MQLTLNKRRMLEVTELSGESAVELVMREMGREGEFTGNPMLATDISTSHLCAIGAALIAFADTTVAAAKAELLAYKGE